MSPKDRAKPHAPPDCPREYHDDYIGRPAPRPVNLKWLGVAVVAVAVSVCFYLLIF